MKNRALFLDKDGVINVDHGYVCTPERTVGAAAAATVHVSSERCTTRVGPSGPPTCAFCRSGGSRDRSDLPTLLQ